MRGPTPFGSRALEILIDARDRLLRPGGRIIAREDRVMVAPVRTPQTFRREVVQAHEREGVLLDPVERIAFDTPMACSIAAGDLVAPEQCWAILDYETVTGTDAAGALHWQLDRAITVDGLAVWFETDLGHGITFTTALVERCQPTAALHSVSPPSHTRHSGDELRVELSTRQVGDSYVLGLAQLAPPAGSTTRSSVGDQNSLAELVLDPAAVPRTSEDTAPSLGPRGAALRALLARLDGRHTMRALAADFAADCLASSATGAPRRTSSPNGLAVWRAWSTVGHDRIDAADPVI